MTHFAGHGGISPPPDFPRSQGLADDYPEVAGYLVALDMWLRSMRGYFPRVRTYSLSVPAAGGATAANSTSEVDYDCPGLGTTDIVYVNKETPQAGLGIVGARVSAIDTLSVLYMNTTAGGITPAADEFMVTAIRR